jgi:hypothetical protein
VPDTATSIKVTIAWDDEQFEAESPDSIGAILNNDLDLVVTRVTGIGGNRVGQSHYSWWLDPACPYLEAQRTVADDFDPELYSDHRNNVEQVVIDDPIPGTWQVVVQSWGINQPQPFAIMISYPPTLP